MLASIRNQLKKIETVLSSLVEGVSNLAAKPSAHSDETATPFESSRQDWLSMKNITDIAKTVNFF